MKARTSKDNFGIEIRSYLTDQNVNLDYSLIVEEPSSVIDAIIQKDGTPKYEAALKGAADFGWTTEELKKDFDNDIKIIQLGSLTSYIEPGASNVEKWFSHLRESGKYLLTFDPNIRHPLDGQTETAVRNRAKILTSLAHVVKASDEDLRWINPDKSPQDSALEIIKSGAVLVVVTLGKDGAFAINREQEFIEVSTPEINVTDTIGAGDTFAAALKTQILEKQIFDETSLSKLNKTELAQILSNSALTASITCSRQGANPPHRHEVTW
jgi:fructokinase